MSKNHKNNKKVNKPASPAAKPLDSVAEKTPEVPEQRKGIYTEYLDQNLTIDQLNVERKIQLKKISDLREGRDILVYAADMRKGHIAPISITPDDLTPITDQLSVLDGDKIDLILETPGGLGETAEDIVDLIRNQYKEFNVIIPGAAKSAGTIIAMAGDDILMEPSSALGPIDAQILYQGKQFSAEAFIKGLDDIKQEVITDGDLNKAYIPILQAISPGEIRHAQNAMEFARVLVRDWLVKYKFKNWTERKRDGKKITDKERITRATQIAKKLSEHNTWLTHGRSIKIPDLRNMELIITDYSEQKELAEAIRRYKILLKLTFEKSNIFKVYETPFSQITSQVNIPQQNSPQNILDGLAQAAKDASSFDIEVDCHNCHHKSKVQARFTKNEPLKPDFINFPATNKLKCAGCQNLLDITNIRQDLERQTGKKIIS